MGAEGWVPFRDVFEVDGVRVRDRDDRLKKLFLDAPPEQAVENARTILAESARYNIGPVERTLNIPTLALALAQPGYGVRFTYTKRGETSENGVRLWEIEYREVSRPTIIRSTTGGDLVESGS